MRFFKKTVFTLLAITTCVTVSTDDWFVAKAGPDGAYPDCPCARNVGAQSLDQRFPQLVVIQDSKVYVRRGNNLVTPDFGTGMCASWEAAIDPICLNNTPPKWCDHKWCYVNSTFCQRRLTKSDFFPGLVYSYETCGNVNRYFPPAHDFSSSPVYAYGFGFEASLQPDSGYKFTDMFLRLATDVLPVMGLAVNTIRYRRQLSEASRKKYESLYTACVYDIALGNLDICLGDLWETRERQEIGHVAFAHVYDEPMYLLTHLEVSDGSFWDRLRKPFVPFEWDLWLLIFVVIVGVAISMVIFEFHRNESDFEVRSLRSGFFKSLYLSASSFINAGVAYNATTASGRILSVGYGVFILITIASFTAETATFLISRAQVQKHSSIEDALSDAQTICFDYGMIGLLETKYPPMKKFGVPLAAEIYDGDILSTLLSNGTCDYAVIGELWLAEYWEAGEHCEMMFVGPAVLSHPAGFWVRPSLAKALRWAIVEQRNLGAWSAAQNAFQTQSACPKSPQRSRRLFSGSTSGKLDRPKGSSPRGRRLKASKASSSSEDDDDDEDEPAHLDSYHMLGVLLVTVSSIVVASVVRCCELFVCPHPEDEELENIIAEEARHVHDSFVGTFSHLSSREHVKNQNIVESVHHEFDDVVATHNGPRDHSKNHVDTVAVPTSSGLRKLAHCSQNNEQNGIAESDQEYFDETMDDIIALCNQRKLARSKKQITTTLSQSSEVRLLKSQSSEERLLKPTQDQPDSIVVDSCAIGRHPVDIIWNRQLPKHQACLGSFRSVLARYF